jgi:outer membrane biosynthesis protein TonB
MDRSDGIGLGASLTGHILLFGAFALGLSQLAVKPPAALPDTIDVTFASETGLISAAREPASAAPAIASAPDLGEPAPAPTPAPEPELEPEPIATPAPPPKPVPKSEPKPEPKPIPKPEPKPAPSKTAVKPATKPATKAVAKPVTKPIAKPGLSRDLLKDIPRSSSAAKPTNRPAGGARLSSNILDGIKATPTPGKGTKPRAATVSARDIAGLAALIQQQVKPCYTTPSGGADADRIVTVFRLRFNPNGTISGTPEILENERSGVTPTNQAYVQQMDEAAKRAVSRCAPLKLPAELYDSGWKDIIFRFNPRAIG